jgi:hypothetical protein
MTSLTLPTVGDLAVGSAQLHRNCVLVHCHHGKSILGNSEVGCGVLRTHPHLDFFAATIGTDDLSD